MAYFYGKKLYFAMPKNRKMALLYILKIFLLSGLTEIGSHNFCIQALAICCFA